MKPSPDNLPPPPPPLANMYLRQARKTLETKNTTTTTTKKGGGGRAIASHLRNVLKCQPCSAGLRFSSTWCGTTPNIWLFVFVKFHAWFFKYIYDLLNICQTERLNLMRTLPKVCPSTRVLRGACECLKTCID